MANDNEDSSEIPKRLKEALDRVEELRRISSESKCAYRINEFCAAYGLSRTTTYALIATGKLRSVVVGGRRLIHRADAEALFSEVR